jgi:ribosomal protein S10
MRQYCLLVKSKNEKSLEKFVDFFIKQMKTKFNSAPVVINVQTSKKIVTLLKSPHVNKTAQEHFESRTFTKKILIDCSYSAKDFFLLKKLLNGLFQDILICVEIRVAANSYRERKKSFFYSKNFKLSKTRLLQINVKRQKKEEVRKKIELKKKRLLVLTKFIEAVNVFGEMSLQKLTKNKASFK